MTFRQLTSFFVIALAPIIKARDDDQFNYRATADNPSGGGKDYGPALWNGVTCDNLGSCLGFPNSWEGSVGWTPDTNICRWCPETGNSCGLHHQSPIDLKRDRAIIGNINEKECPDWHLMKSEDGACTWNDLINNKNGAVHTNNFFIKRHALHILEPLTPTGELACLNQNGRRYPRIDFSKGFPNFFNLAHTEITVPSVHTQEGKRYDAEVHLAHFYQVGDIPKNKIGTVALFLEGVQGVPHWEFLDKLICQWRETEEQNRAACGLPSVLGYPGCRNLVRGRTAAPVKPPTTKPTVRNTPAPFKVNVPTTKPTVRQTPAPSKVKVPTTKPTVRQTPAPSKVKVPTTKPTVRQTPAPSKVKLPTKAPTLCPPTSSGASPHPVYPRISCDGISNIGQVCASQGCCDSKRSTTSFCQSVYGDFPGILMGSVCWYCCSVPKEVGQARVRYLRSNETSQSTTSIQYEEKRISKEKITMPFFEGTHEDYLFDNEIGVENVASSNGDREEIEGDDDAYFESLMEPFRELDALNETITQERHLLNYDHIAYDAYEWLRAVKTEYYFRYEGTFTTPPCSEVVHWRILKDPIRVHPDQIKELERLLARRISPKGSMFKECQNDSAGKLRPGRQGDAVDLNRPLQSLHTLHRMVFCECKDWKSNFDEDIQWCLKDINTRLYDAPYGYGIGDGTNGTHF